MSLLDDVSIVVTPNGYKAGELYAVVPVPTEGAEEVTNGDFATDTWWGLDSSWTISGGSANSNGTGTMYKGGILTIGKRYIVKVDVSAYTSGSLSYPNASYNIPSSIGTYTFDYVASSQTISFTGTSFVGSIDNVSVKEYTSADMDVTRATAATRVDENGLVNYAEVIGDSILTGNNSNFDTGIGSWVTYNGGTLAHSTDKLEVTLTSGESGARIDTNSLISGGQSGKTFKVRARVWQGTTTATALKIYIGASQENITISSTPTYFEVELTTISTGMLTIYRAGGLGGVGTYFIDDVTVKEVTRDNVPRIDYTGGGCPHILAEPQRTNLLPYSEDFSQWILNSVTLTANATTSPSGSLDATLVDLSATTDSRLVNNVGVVSSTQYTFSIYLKKHESDSDGTFPLAYYDGSNYIKTYVNLTDVWQRFDLTFMNPSGSIFGYGLSRKGTTSDETLTRCYAWAGQLEQASYPTSYIPTNGEAGGVTRNQDIFTRDGIGSLINSTEGVLFVELENITGTDATNKMISITDGSLTNKISLFVSSNQISVESAGSGTNLGIYSKALQSGFNKIAVKYKVNDCALWVNGTEYTDTSFAAFTSSTLNALVFDRGDGTQNLFGKVKQLQVYDTALDDTQLAALTS